MKRSGTNFAASALALTLASLAPAADSSANEAPAIDPGAQALVDRYLEARGGAERWREVRTLAVSGVYAAFSEKSPFTLVRARPDRFRLDFHMLGRPTIRAKDATSLWWQQPILDIGEPSRVQSGPAIPQLEREALFGPILLDARARGIGIRHQGSGEVDGVATVVLAVAFPNGSSETWHLDAETAREVMIESSVHDFTQGMMAMKQRAYFDDFRKVDGLVLPHHVELEFGARLEVIEIERVEVNPELDAGRFAMPEASAPP